MPRRCAVPGCSSNYAKEKKYTTVFFFPSNTALREKWVKSINRKNFTPGKEAVVCVNHFEERFVIKEDKVVRDDGSILCVPRQRFTLTDDSFPSIFPNQPAYLSKALPMKRKSPETRRESLQKNDENNFKKWLKDDEIISFVDLKSKVEYKSMEASVKYPDLYVMSKFPGITSELKKFLPKEVKLVIVPISDQRIKWDTSISISEEEMDFVKNAELIVIDSMFLAKMLYQLPKVKWAQNTWAGVEMLFEVVDSSKPFPAFQVTRYVDPYFGELMANYVIAQIVNIERGFYVYRDKQNTSEWSRPFFPDFRVLSELTVGVLGAGNLGASVGKLLKKAGCRVIAYVRKNRELSSDSYDEATTYLNVILEGCDYICNVLPSTKNTEGLLDGDVLKNCKRKPVFINIGRGDIIKEDTIIKALKEGWISKAVLDVFEKEPLPADSPLWKMPGVYITPHVGAIPKIKGIAKFIADNYMKYVNGEPLMNVIDWKQGY